MQSPNNAPSGGRSTALLFVVFLLATFWFASAVAAQDQATQFELTRTALRERIETERLISKEKNDWRVGKESLVARSAAMKRDIGSLRKRIEDARKSIAEAQKELTSMGEEKQARSGVTTTLETRIAAYEQRILKILPRLPDPLRERIRPLSQRLPDPRKQGDRKELPISERYQNVIGVLNEIGKWNRQVTVTNEERQMLDGSLVSVDVIYIGLGQAFYSGRPDKSGNATVGGVGVADAGKWSWKPANDLAKDVQKAIRVYRNEQLAQMVRLPVQIL